MAEEVAPTWFKVHYGSAETALFNADCWAVVLLDYIKERCGYSQLYESVDLMKEDGSSCLELRTKGKEFATSFLDPKGTYILCKVVAAEEGGGADTYEQLWTPPEGMEAPPAAGKKK